MTFEKPNYTETPNELFDDHMKHMGEAELRVVLAVVRKTLGYHKEKDELSLTQIQEMTGLSRQGAHDGVTLALEHQHIEECGTGKRGVKIYRLCVSDDQSARLTSPLSRPELVKPVDTQKKSKEKETKDSVPEKIGTDTSKKKANPWYDTIHAVWGYAGSLNGEMQKMLQGVSQKAAFKDGNILPALAVEDVGRWAGWYRAVELGGNAKLNMLEDRMKIQSSVEKWRSLGCPDATAAEFQDYVSDDEDTDAESPSAFIARMRRDHGWE